MVPRRELDARRGQHLDALPLQRDDPHPLLGLVLLGIGFGSTNVIFGGTVAGSTGVRNNEQGVAGALVNAARQIGAAIGVAIVLSVVTLRARTPGSSDTAAGYRLALMCWAGIGVAAALLSLALPGRRRAARDSAPTLEHRQTTRS